MAGGCNYTLVKVPRAQLLKKRAPGCFILMRTGLCLQHVMVMSLHTLKSKVIVLSQETAGPFGVRILNTIHDIV